MKTQVSTFKVYAIGTIGNARHGDAPSEPRSPHVGPHCAACDHITLVSPCTRPGCEGWAIVCQGCPDVVDRFVASGGLCEACRAG